MKKKEWEIGFNIVEHVARELVGPSLKPLLTSFVISQNRRTSTKICYKARPQLNERRRYSLNMPTLVFSKNQKIKNHNNPKFTHKLSQ